MNKQKLYESIMANVAKQVKKAINESAKLENIEYFYHATPSCYVSSIKKYGLGEKCQEHVSGIMKEHNMKI